MRYYAIVRLICAQEVNTMRVHIGHAVPASKVLLVLALAVTVLIGLYGYTSAMIDVIACINRVVYSFVPF